MGIIGSVASVIGTGDNFQASATLFRLMPGSQTKSNKMTDKLEFQYFPDTIQDNRSVDYVSKTTVGSSHPIYQWLHGSEREISFDAVFTCDYSAVGVPGGPGSAIKEAGDLFGSVVKSPVAGIIGALKKDIPEEWNIARDIAWLRACTYPDYTTKPMSPPPILLLELQGVGMRSGAYEKKKIASDNKPKNALQRLAQSFKSLGKDSTSNDVEPIPVLMKQCNIQYESFFQTGRPRVVTVSLAFVEVVQVGKAWQWVDRRAIDPEDESPNSKASDKKSSGPGGLPSL